MTASPTASPPDDVPAKPATLAQCYALIDTLGQQLAQLREQVAWLQERVKLDSRNSSKPPSSDLGARRGPRPAAVAASAGRSPGTRGRTEHCWPRTRSMRCTSARRPRCANAVGWSSRAVRGATR
jgi:hypothetical protein